MFCFYNIFLSILLSVWPRISTVGIVSQEVRLTSDVYNFWSNFCTYARMLVKKLKVQVDWNDKWIFKYLKILFTLVAVVMMIICHELFTQNGSRPRFVEKCGLLPQHYGAK